MPVVKKSAFIVEPQSYIHTLAQHDCGLASGIIQKSL